MYAGTVDRVWRRAVQGSRGVLHECCITASIVLLVHVSEQTVRISRACAHSTVQQRTTTNSPALVDESRFTLSTGDR